MRLYQKSPASYAEAVLGVNWWSGQQRIAEAVRDNQRVFVRASHSVGKTHVAAGIVNWFFDLWYPGITITTAPSEQQLKDVLWKEIRAQRRGRPGLMPKTPRMESSPDHFAEGITTSKGAAFQGRHDENVLIVFDEATEIDTEYWESAAGMMTGTVNCHWLAICNPTNTNTNAFLADQSEEWVSFGISALEHPNIQAALEGKPLPYRNAVTLQYIERSLREWCTRLEKSDATITDVEFPKGSNNWYRPGPLFESRVLGRWPTGASNSVWSETRWQAAIVRQPIPQEPLVIGCDVARFGDDKTVIMARRGPCVIHHESHNGWGTDQTAGRLKAVARQLVQPGEAAINVSIFIDDDGVGGGVTDQARGFNFIGMSGARRALREEEYPNRRSESWFTTAERADRGAIDLSRLKDSHQTLRSQLLAPRWRLDSQGRRVVEPKADTKRRIQRSPDDADALNLTFSPLRRHIAPIMAPQSRGRVLAGLITA